MICNNLLKAKSVEELFEQYKTTHDIAVKQEIVLHYSGIVKTIAIQLRGVYISFAEMDDIINEGIITLMQVIDKFDPGKNAKFETYASLRIRGAIIDLARKQDWIPRNVRKLGKSIDQTFSDLYFALGRYPTETEMAEQLGISLSKYHKALSETNLFNILSLDALVDGLQEEGQNEKFLKDQSLDSAPTYTLERKELAQMIKNAIHELKENEQLVVSLYYNKELSMKEIAGVMGISEPRVSQLHASALRKLRLSLGNYYTA
ncbi:sigma-70 family RNA polymerase sigma factor [Clostridium aminobutyricum]|uniref:FliA/WhiG family RNA polymerase sigma factor n=1 Tax=Clostridium aminobutyricum TaxID=33953 RepID=A0A939IGQ8_CLOAM|nr:FliA/WhiG family RNA polymerase sigma factor [Clostridium aminobutyricum]MBN7773725.1 FliA/WhiG family RNA polymerase sigma factor [Clostridium aminobutyricum]